MFLSDTILSDHKNCVTAIISEDIVIYMFLFGGNLLSSTISSCKRELLIRSEALCQKLRIIMVSKKWTLCAKDYTCHIVGTVL